MPAWVTRKLRGDLIEVFETCKDYRNINKDSFCDIAKFNVGGHSLKLNKKRTHRC